MTQTLVYRDQVRFSVRARTHGVARAAPLAPQ
jgi:hypothetical protein